MISAGRYKQFFHRVADMIIIIITSKVVFFHPPIINPSKIFLRKFQLQQKALFYLMTTDGPVDKISFTHV